MQNLGWKLLELLLRAQGAKKRGVPGGGGTQGPGRAGRGLAQQPRVAPSMCPSTPLLDPRAASTLLLAPASLPVLELIKTLSRLWFASLKAGSCPRHCPERSGAQLLPSTSSILPSQEGAGTQMHPQSPLPTCRLTLGTKPPDPDPGQPLPPPTKTSLGT